jgi:hypothetical protein
MSDRESESEGVWILYESVNSGDVLRQGDLIKFARQDKPPSYGIVVTADCDLDNRKHSRLVTLVPLLSAEQIVCQCLAFDAFESQKDALQQYCRTQLGIEDQPNTAAFLGKVKSLVRDGSISDPVVDAAARAVAHEELSVSVPVLRAVLAGAGISWPKSLDRFAMLRRVEN